MDITLEVLRATAKTTAELIIRTAPGLSHIQMHQGYIYALKDPGLIPDDLAHEALTTLNQQAIARSFIEKTIA